MNGVSVLELSHSEVVALIQGLPMDFRLVVARKRELTEDEPITAEAELDMESQPNESGSPGERTCQSDDFSSYYMGRVGEGCVVYGVYSLMVKVSTFNVYGALYCD